MTRNDYINAVQAKLDSLEREYKEIEDYNRATGSGIQTHLMCSWSEWKRKPSDTIIWQLKREFNELNARKALMDRDFYWHQICSEVNSIK